MQYLTPLLGPLPPFCFLLPAYAARLKSESPCLTAKNIKILLSRYYEATYVGRSFCATVFFIPLYVDKTGKVAMNRTKIKILGVISAKNLFDVFLVINEGKFKNCENLRDKKMIGFYEAPMCNCRHLKAHDNLHFAITILISFPYRLKSKVRYHRKKLDNR